MGSAQRPWGLVRAAVVVLGAAVASVASAQAVPMRLYPLSGIPPTPASAVADAQSLVESAAMALVRRGQNLQPATPLLVRPSCGAVPEPACLVRLAGDGVIVFGAVHAADGILAVNLRAVDARGRVLGPVRAGVDAYIQSAEPFVRALLAIDARLGLAPTPQASAPPRKALGEALRAPPPRPSEPARQAARSPGGEWRRSAGKVLLVGGAALAGAGAGIAFLDRRLSDSLEQKYQAGTLTAADADSYRRVDRYNVAATVLLAAGAATAATGVTLWILAPDASGGAQVGVSGRF